MDGKEPGKPANTGPFSVNLWKVGTIRQHLWHGAGLDPFKGVGELAIRDQVQDIWDQKGWPLTAHRPVPRKWYAASLASEDGYINALPGTMVQYGQSFYFLGLLVEALIKQFAIGQPMPEVGGVPHGWDDEEPTDDTYEWYVKSMIFSAIGVTRARAARDLRDEPLAADEALYHAGIGAAGDPGVPYVIGQAAPGPKWQNFLIGPSVWHTEPRLVPAAYGTGNLKGGIYHGGWSMAAVDIVRLLASFDLASNQILSSTAIAEMWSNPPEFQDDNTYLGWNGVPEKVKGFRIRQGKFLIHPDVQLFHHNGATTGAIAFAMRREDGLSIAVVFNKNTIPGLYVDPHGLELSDIATEVADVAPWPTWDLFPQYDLPPFLPRRGYQARLKVQT